jgi:outer membrane lipoprotein carrier protein
MKIKFFITFYCIFINFSFANEINLISEVENYFNNIRTLSADFEQVSPLNKQKSSSGKLYISKPGMLRFDYLKPKKLTIILRDENIMYHDHELQEVSYVSQSNYFFKLLSEKNIKLAGDVKKINLSNNEVYLYIDKMLDNVNTSIMMVLSHNPMNLKEVHINGSEAEKYFLYFTNIKYNLNFDKKFFSLQHPQFYSAPY